jgi:hypothetical protein
MVKYRMNSKGDEFVGGTIKEHTVNSDRTLSDDDQKLILGILKERFRSFTSRHESFEWDRIEARLLEKPNKLWSLNEMEITGGEPDIVGYDKDTKEYIYIDCSKETPIGRRSICYDHEALFSRKTNKPENSAINMATEMGINILTEKEYFELQKLGDFDTKTSSWLLTSVGIRKLKGAIFGDFRYGKVFIYHNGADSYYGVRGFRGSLRV